MHWTDKLNCHQRKQVLAYKFMMDARESHLGAISPVVWLKVLWCNPLGKLKVRGLLSSYVRSKRPILNPSSKFLITDLLKKGVKENSQPDLALNSRQQSFKTQKSDSRLTQPHSHSENTNCVPVLRSTCARASAIRWYSNKSKSLWLPVDEQKKAYFRRFLGEWYRHMELHQR